MTFTGPTNDFKIVHWKPRVSGQRANLVVDGSQRFVIMTITHAADGIKADTMTPFRFQWHNAGLILGLRPANERRRYFVTTSLIGWVQA